MLIVTDASKATIIFASSLGSPSVYADLVIGGQFCICAQDIYHNTPDLWSMTNNNTAIPPVSME